MRTYTVVGVGAIGGYYGARLHQSGLTVRFLARSDAAHVRERGLRVDSPEGDAVIEADVYDEAATMPPSDVVIVAVKTTNSTAVAPMLPSLLAPGGSVVVMQNGLGVEEPFAAAAPEADVVGAMCFMCCNKVGPGHIRHLDEGQITAGAFLADGRAGGVTPAVEALLADMNAAGVAATPVTDLQAGRWQKLVWNIAFNGLSVVVDARTNEMMADPLVRARAETIMREVVVAAAACGHGFDDGVVARMMATTDRMVPYKPSMKLDHEAGRPLELEAIYERPIVAARAAGVAMPETEALLAELRQRAAMPASTRSG
jgi:2-dehydropantoate 2-reductase